MIGIIDYGSGNIAAIARIYKQLGVEYIITNIESELRSVEKLILPGVGDFDETMDLLDINGLRSILDDLVVNKKIPVLGVCVGMHVMARESEEGNKPGLGWIEADVKKLDVSKLNQKPYLPHMGWNEIDIVQQNDIFHNIEMEKGFYFLHSFYFDCDHKEDVLCTTEYGLNFSSGVRHDNVYGMQFHPEKSHGNGVFIFKNFANL